MQKPKFIADADFNEDIIRGLRRAEASIDFLTASDGGTRGLPDRQVIELCRRSASSTHLARPQDDGRRVLSICRGWSLEPGAD
jgi:hypothetical protein